MEGFEKCLDKLQKKKNYVKVEKMVLVGFSDQVRQKAGTGFIIKYV